MINDIVFNWYIDKKIVDGHEVIVHSVGIENEDGVEGKRISGIDFWKKMFEGQTIDNHSQPIDDETFACMMKVVDECCMFLPKCKIRLNTDNNEMVFVNEKRRQYSKNVLLHRAQRVKKGYETVKGPGERV